MKISKLFHTLYAFLMFLPVMVLPLFAININQKEVAPLTAQIEETKVVDFNQLVQNGNFYYGSDYWRTANATLIVQNDTAYCLANSYRGSLVTSEKNLPTADNLKIVVKTYLKTTASAGDISLYFYGGHGFSSNIQSNDFQWIEHYVTTSNSWGVDLTLNNNIRIEDRRTSGFDDVEIKYVMAFNLTQMFGVGNEPTIQQFNNWFSNYYYQYTLSNKQILHTGYLNTLDNTDVGSQFLYSLYNPLKDYFNLPNYMNLGGLYDWFLLNLFSGYNSPVYFIIFDLMIYWLAMSILWLIFDVLMYVPSMIHKMLDKARME